MKNIVVSSFDKTQFGSSLSVAKAESGSEKVFLNPRMNLNGSSISHVSASLTVASVKAGEFKQTVKL